VGLEGLGKLKISSHLIGKFKYSTVKYLSFGACVCKFLDITKYRRVKKKKIVSSSLTASVVRVPGYRGLGSILSATRFSEK
jgi:hypothetical protein